MMELAELDAMLKGAKLPEQTVPLCLRGDLQADWEELDRQLTALQRKSTDTLAGDPAEAALAEKIRGIEAEMADNTLSLRLRGLPRKPWLKLVQAHPPREGNDADKAIGLNHETFYDDLIAKTVVEPVLSGEQLAALLDTISDGQYTTLANAAWALNRQDVAVPFSYTASRISTNSGGTSRQQSV